MGRRSIKATLLGLVVLATTLASQQQVTADNATITDPNDSASVLDVTSVAISNTPSSITYLMTMNDTFLVSSVKRVTLQYDFNEDGVPDNCLLVHPSAYTASGLLGVVMDDCAGAALFGTAETTKPAGNQLQIVLPVSTLRDAGLGASNQSYGVRVETVETWNNAFPVAPNDSAPDTGFVAHTLASPRPDGIIKGLGDGVYNDTAEGQTSTIKVRPKKTASFPLVFGNDAGIDDNLKITGCASSKGYTVTYLDGATDVTSAVTGGTYLTGTLAPDATKALTLNIKLAKTAKKKKVCDVTAASSTAASVLDRVRGVAKVKL